MARSRRGRRRPWAQPHRDLDQDRLASMPRLEAGRDGVEYHVQYLGPASKEYRCPGCLQMIAVGAPHVVVWPEEAAFGVDVGVEARRHWHTACWRRGLRPS